MSFAGYHLLPRSFSKLVIIFSSFSYLLLPRQTKATDSFRLFIMRPTTSSIGQGRRGLNTASSFRRPPPSRAITGAQRTTKPGTAAGRHAAILPSHASVRVTERPVTGVRGLGTRNIKAAGLKSNNANNNSADHANNNNNSSSISSLQDDMPGRQVQDSVFFIGVVRARHTAIRTEIEKLRAEIAENESNTSQTQKMEKTFDDLLREVKDLEGTLADYNMVLDKSHVGTLSDPQHISQYEKELAQRNQTLTKEIDEIFMSKQNRNKDVANIQSEISHAHRTIDEKLQNMETDKLREYRDLTHQISNLHMEGQRQEVELEHLRSQINEVELSMSLRGNSRELRDEWKEQDGKERELQMQISNLKEDMKIAAQMDPKEAQSFLLAKVKENQRKSTELDKQIASLDLGINQLKESKEDIHSNLIGSQTEHAAGGIDCDSNSYETIFRSDEEFKIFLEEANEKKVQLTEEIDQIKFDVVSLLEHISEGIAVSEQELPTKDGFKQMKGDVTFKAKYLETSQLTMARLEEQKSKRLEELHKIDNFEEKIAAEEAQLRKRMDTMRKEMVRFDDIQGLQKRAEDTKNYLNSLILIYTEKIEEARDMVAGSSAQLDRQKRALERVGGGSDTLRNLEQLEQTLRHHGQNIFSMQEYIATKGKQTDFESVKKKCFSMVERLNMKAVESS